MAQSWPMLQKRVQGKWEIPLLLVSLGFLGYGLWSLRPTPERVSAAQAVAFLEQMYDAGSLDDAVLFGEDTLKAGSHTPQEQAPIHLILARVYAAIASREKLTVPALADPIIHHSTMARDAGVELTAKDRLMVGYAREWRREYLEAIQSHRRAIELGIEGADDLRKYIIELQMAHLRPSLHTQHQLYQQFIEEIDPARGELVVWGAEGVVRTLEGMGRLKEATDLLVRLAEPYSDEDLVDEFGYLQSWVMQQSGMYEEASLRLRGILDRQPPTSALSAKASWLMGRCVLFDDGPQRPQEAISWFDQVLRYHESGPVVTAVHLGRAEALAMLERHDEAYETYQRVMETPAALEGNPFIDQAALRKSLVLQAELLRAAQRPTLALTYATMARMLLRDGESEVAAPVLQLLANIEQEIGDRLTHEWRKARERWQDATEEAAPALLEELQAIQREAQGHYGEASRHYLDLARVSVTNNLLSADAAWKSADMAEESGDLVRAAELFEGFVSERQTHSYVPRGLYRLGLLYQKQGLYQKAVGSLEQVRQRFPRSLDSARGLIPLAECYLELRQPDDAERTLMLVLGDSEVFTPEAPEFSDALFLLGDMLNRRGDHERAIERLDEALTRFPKDKRRERAMFLSADSYRQSGLLLSHELKQAKFASQIRQMKGESVKRLEQARELYQKLIDELELKGMSRLGTLEMMYLRLSYLYQADCYFETQDYEQALQIYEEAAAIFRGSVSVLPAYVRVIQCHIYLGQPAEARAALARAQVLVQSIPDQAFQTSLSPQSRQDWKRYFDWLAKSELF